MNNESASKSPPNRLLRTGGSYLVADQLRDRVPGAQLRNEVERMFHAAFPNQFLQLGGLRVAVFGERQRGGAALDQVGWFDAVAVGQFGGADKAVIGLELAHRVAPDPRYRVHQRGVREAGQNLVDHAAVVQRAPMFAL